MISRKRLTRWLAWAVGAAALVAVVVTALHFSEEREFARLVEQAKPGWLVAAVALQAATYFAQAEVIRGAPRAAGVSLPRWWLYRLSLTKLFIDQALPSAGLSSTVVIVKALQQRAVPHGSAAACAMINIASYHAAYAVVLIVALAMTSSLRETNLVLVSTSALFITFALALTAAILVSAGRRVKTSARLARLPVIRRAAGFLQDADPTLVRNPRLFCAASGWQASIFLLDAATMWVCIRALGAAAPADAVFTSFMISSLVRTMAVVPGGLGAYEAASVLTLRLVGVSLSVGLSATLIFRGLSFWIPMLPGLWFSRRIIAPGT